MGPSVSPRGPWGRPRLSAGQSLVSDFRPRVPGSPQYPQSPEITPSRRVQRPDVARLGPEIGPKWAEIGGKSAETRPEMARNGAEMARFRGEFGPLGVDLSAKNGRPGPERRLMATRIYDNHKEGRSPDRPGAGPRSAGLVRAGSRDGRGAGENWLRFGGCAAKPVGFVLPATDRRGSGPKLEGRDVIGFVLSARRDRDWVRFCGGAGRPSAPSCARASRSSRTTTRALSQTASLRRDSPLCHSEWAGPKTVNRPVASRSPMRPGRDQIAFSGIIPLPIIEL
jgi:hypothetical protein